MNEGASSQSLRRAKEQAFDDIDFEIPDAQNRLYIMIKNKFNSHSEYIESLNFTNIQNTYSKGLMLLWEDDSHFEYEPMTSPNDLYTLT